MDRREQRSKKRTAVTKEQAINFLCANDAADQYRETHQCGEGKQQRDHAAQRGRDASGQRRASCVSLSRRLSAFFGSTSDQGPKAAKFAVLTPGRAGFPNRAKRSEGSDSTPIRNTPCFAV